MRKENRNTISPLQAAAGPNEVTSFSEQWRAPLHGVSQPGITCIDLQLATDRIVTGGVDKQVIVFDRNDKQIVRTFSGHTARISRVAYHPTDDIVLSASDDSTVRLWSLAQGECTLQLDNAHDSAITGLHLHPTNEYVLTASRDTSWAFSSLASGLVLTRTRDPESFALTCAQLHPDGQILATGTAHAAGLRIWDLKEGTNVANLQDHEGDMTALTFSENGYHLVAAASDNVVRVWDLRKLAVVKAIALKSRVEALCIDASASYLGVGGVGEASGIYQCRKWEALLPLDQHGEAAVTGLRFGRDAHYVVTSCMDRHIRFFSSL